MTVETDRDHAELGLESEYETIPVPQNHRKSLLAVAAVWFGFPMIITCAIFGGVIVAFLGFWLGVLAILTGNLILAAYVGALSYRAGSTGRNFALQAQQTFGRVGYVIVAGFLATVVVGWFAFQVGLTGATMSDSYGANKTLMALIAGVLFIAITFIGIRALAILGGVAAPLFFVVAAIAIFLAVQQNGFGSVLSYRPDPGVAGGLTFGAAVSLVIATFADSGTMTADFTRWAKNGGQGFLAALTAFPLANFMSFLVGGIIVASGAVSDPTTNGGNFMPVLANGGLILSVLAVLFIFVNLGSVCTHCLYNGAVGWAAITGRSMRMVTLILGTIGVIVALAGVWSLFLDWLNLLGILVPPLGVILIVDHLVLGRQRVEDRVPPYRPAAFIAWGIGSAVALLVSFQAPQYSAAIVGIIVAAVIYTVATLAMPKLATSP